MRHAITTILVSAWLLTATGCEILTTINPSKATRNDSLTMKIPASGKMSVLNSNGTVECIAADVNEISIEAKVMAYGPTDEEAAANLELVDILTKDDGDVAELIVDYPRGISGGTSLTITLPRELSLNLKSSNGAITVTGVVGGVNAESSNGGIRVTKASGDVTVNTSNGGVAIAGENISRLKIGTSNGAVRFSGNLTEGSHSISTSNGAIDVELVGGVTEVTAKTSNGKIVKDGEKMKSGQVFRLGDSSADAETVSTMKLRTSNGAVRVRMVPSDTKLAKTESKTNAADAGLRDTQSENDVE